MSTNRRVKRRVYFDGERAFVTLSSGDTAVVDTDDVGRVSQRSWRRAAKGYAVATINSRTEYMHRLLLNAPAGKHVDHIDCDRMNNRRSNLRLCSRSENLQNQPVRARGYKGVYPAGRRYFAKIVVAKRQRYLGTFETAEHAAYAYDRAAREHFGAFARCNFPEESKV